MKVYDADGLVKNGPGPAGPAGAAGAQGPMGPAAFLSAEDGEDGWHAIPGRDGASGAAGVQGPVGPAVFLAADDGEDGWHAVPGAPGTTGPIGATGAQGPAGPALFFLAEDGADGDPGPPGVAIASSNTSGIVLIGKSTAASPVASLTVSGIPAGYSALHLVIYGASTGSSNSEMLLTFNGDTAANYDMQYLQGFGSTTQAGSVTNQNSAPVGTFSTSTTVPGVVSTIIPGYDSTTLGKTGTGTASIAGSTNFAQLRTIVWHPSTPAAINSITVTIQANTINTGGFLAVYGMA